MAAMTSEQRGQVTLTCVQQLTIWDQLLNQLVDFLRLLTLASALTVDDITANTSPDAWRVRALLTNQANLFGMLQVVPMRFGHSSVDCHFDPHYLVN